MHAAEQERADVRAAREAWFEAQPELDPDRLVFLDETAAATNMARRYGWAPRGERCRLASPQRALQDHDRHRRPAHERAVRHRAA